MRKLIRLPILRTRFLFPILLSALALAAVACSDDNGAGAFSFGDSTVQSTGGSQRVGAPSAIFAQSDGADFAFDQAIEEQAVFDAVDAEAAFAPAAEPSPNGPGADPALQVLERRVIQNASLTIQVDDVRTAATAVRDVAVGLGGFVEQLSVSGDGEFASGFVVIRVPQEEFFAAQDRLNALGTVLDESVGSQDVTEQFVDLDARLRSLESEEASLLQLLDRANTVSEILIVENELTRIRTEIERLQGQLNFLERRVALATISVSLFPPQAVFTEPPSASFTIEVGRVERSSDAIKDLAEQMDGVVDRASLRVNDGDETATIQIRVPRESFEAAVAVVEGLGDVREKVLNEGGGEKFPERAGIGVVDPDEPDARIDVRLFGGDDGDDTALIASLAGSLGGVALLLAIGGVIWSSRRRSAGPVNPTSS